MAKILIIDDEEMIRSLAERILQRDSHTVLTAENGTIAIELFTQQKETIDIIIVDLHLDDMDGIDILTEIRKISAHIPSIISSGNNFDKNDLPENLRQNIFFLPKPYKASMLTELVSSILAHV